MTLNIVFFASDKGKEYEIGDAFCTGAKAHGDKASIISPADYEGPREDTDVAVMIGVKGWSRLLMDTHLAAGKHCVYLDKGYIGGAPGPRSKYIRCSVDSFQPLDYFQKTPRPADRWRQLGIEIQPWRRNAGKEIIIAGGSLKYALWHRLNGNDGMDPATTWAVRTLRRLRKYTQRPVVYSPKPTWKDAVPIEGARFVSRRIPIEIQLTTAWCLVTFGSSAAVDAQIAGVPTFVLGDGIAKPVSADNLIAVETPYCPTDKQRYQWLCDVAYAQFHLREFWAGLAWSILRPQVIANTQAKE